MLVCGLRRLQFATFACPDCLPPPPVGRPRTLACGSAGPCAPAARATRASVTETRRRCDDCTSTSTFIDSTYFEVVVRSLTLHTWSSACPYRASHQAGHDLAPTCRTRSNGPERPATTAVGGGGEGGSWQAKLQIERRREARPWRGLGAAGQQRAQACAAPRRNAGGANPCSCCRGAP